MKRITLQFFSALILMALSVVMSQAQNTQRVALVIGNGAYQDAPLKNPPNDARAMAQALRECDFEVIEKINSNKREMIEGIREFGKNIRRGGVGLFFYAGHGMQVGSTNYLVPVGVDVKSEGDVEFECVDANRVLGQMEDAENRINIIILDACRNNPFARSFRSSDRGLKRMDAPKGSLLAYATEPGDVAADGDGANGLYTSALLKHMRTPGLSVVQVFQRAGGEVRKTSGDSQVPWIAMSLTDDFYFVPDAPQPSIAPERITPLFSTPSPVQERITPSSPVFGHLQVSVNAQDSRVYTNGKYRGKANPQSPLNVPEMGLGKVEVRVEAEGYKTQQQGYFLIPDQWAVASFQLLTIKEEMLREMDVEIASLTTEIAVKDRKIKNLSKENSFSNLFLSGALLIGLPAYDLQKRDKHPKWRNVTGWTCLTLGIMADFGFIIGRNDLKKVKEERTKLQKQLDYQQNRRRRGALSSGEEDSME
jgi:hypothetical protein